MPKLSSIKKAIVAFLAPVVPAVYVTVDAGHVTRDGVWLIVLAVLQGLGVYGVSNSKS
jgi:hypothetical protein